ncbi:hypothetical protein GK047_18820 [Paenibacillus sp. SYP-B3998]|uniref:Uncharacterized protein n=1 Tax=Paenibacillus sp. SYP-B3998 TaxID=2678564 RepID=A0A6G4A329_9BACL|nr:hypothetical protein [Paenibacillus sp. SYP-B3998]NEW08057.1 hypothetical protein [Paenibacillus sp. SYP-B3998]
MQNAKQTDLVNRRKAWIGEARALLPLLSIWGIAWIFSALIDFAIVWRNFDWLKQAVLITAVAASLIQIWNLRKESRSESGSGVQVSDRSGWGHPIFLLLPGALLIAAVALLEAIGAIGPLFTPVLRAFILAIGFVQFGLLLGKPLVYLGLWLFTLSAIMGVWYLGYSAVVLEGMGGISLLVSAYMLRVWGK